MPPGQWLSPREVATWLGVSQATLSVWRRDGSGPPFVAGPDGNILAQSDTDAPDLVLADLDAGALRRQRIRLPFRRDDSLRHALQMGRDILARKVRRERFLDGPIGEI